VFVTNGPNTIEHANADCDCSSCKQLHKPAKIIALPSLMFRDPATLMNKTADIKTGGIKAQAVQSNVILLSAVLKTAAQLRVQKTRQAKFHYPMLECS